ncbi:hypothetical protein SPI_03697 [Niveomyces insectorum RCEF 264]|uniref:Single-strand DNA deaminase toxin A-like C-terminal domain-containing protein n=1 Tax=Niveomyces insectorum RCEF 264 TaxID=1081102 RepID=A0A167WAB4_9HYPO|nr:hypothetical protein SPI_03697 [Niveomyces insectorum RCEF 264]
MDEPDGGELLAAENQRRPSQQRSLLETAPHPGYAFAWRHGGRQLVVLTQTAQAQTGFPGATVVEATPACLVAAGRSRPEMVCTSGWRPPKKPASTLNSERWTELVRRFAAAVDFHLPPSIRDTPGSSVRVPDNDGRYLACHAEKKLGLYFLVQQMKAAGVSLDEALNGRLQAANLPLHRRRATIMLGHKPCKNCLDFLKYIRRRTGIDVRTQPCPVFAEHTRKRMFFRSDLKPADDRPAQAPVRAPNHNATTQEEDEQELTQHDEDVLQEDSNSGEDLDDDDGDDVEAQQHGESVADDPLEQAEAVLDHVSTGNVRPSTTAAPLTTGADDNSKEDDVARLTQPKTPEPPIVVDPPPRLSGRLSVTSTPPPATPTELWRDATPSDGRQRRRRFSPYCTPGRLGGGLGGPPSIWGASGKPRPTPCLKPPASSSGGGNDDGRTNESTNHRRLAVAPPLRMSAILSSSSSSQPSSTSTSNHCLAGHPRDVQSFFFGTPSQASQDNEQAPAARAATAAGPGPASHHAAAEHRPAAVDDVAVGAVRQPPPPPPGTDVEFLLSTPAVVRNVNSAHQQQGPQHAERRGNDNSVGTPVDDPFGPRQPQPLLPPQQSVFERRQGHAAPQPQPQRTPPAPPQPRINRTSAQQQLLADLYHWPSAGPGSAPRRRSVLLARRHPRLVPPRLRLPPIIDLTEPDEPAVVAVPPPDVQFVRVGQHDGSGRNVPPHTTATARTGRHSEQHRRRGFWERNRRPAARMFPDLSAYRFGSQQGWV